MNHLNGNATWEYEMLRLCVPGQKNYLISYYEVAAMADVVKAQADAATTARMLAEARALASFVAADGSQTREASPK